MTWESTSLTQRTETRGADLADRPGRDGGLTISRLGEVPTGYAWCVRELADLPRNCTVLDVLPYLDEVGSDYLGITTNLYGGDPYLHLEVSRVGSWEDAHLEFLGTGQKHFWDLDV